MKTLKELNEELDAFNATLNDENEDTPELLAEQERLLNAIIAAEAADLGALSAKAVARSLQQARSGRAHDRVEGVQGRSHRQDRGPAAGPRARA